MDVSYGRILWFPQLIGEGWGWGAIDDGVEQLGLCHPLFSFLLLRLLGSILEPRCLWTNVGAILMVAS